MGKRHFAEEDIQMAHLHMTSFSTLLATRETQTKTTRNCHYPTVGRTKMKNGDDTKCRWRCRDVVPHRHGHGHATGMGTLEKRSATTLKSKHAMTIVFLGIHCREVKIMTTQKPVQKCSQHLYSQEQKTGSNSDAV